MCWKCGRVRPYDTPPVPGAKRIGLQTFLVDGVEYTAVDHIEKDPDEILKLIDEGLIENLEDFEYGFGWGDLCEYPPLDSKYFTRKVSQ